jgi:cyclic beta-1,2-glucan synthetase
MATQILLQERIPQNVPLILPKAAEFELESESRAKLPPLLRHFTNPNLTFNKLQLLSNHKYSLMITVAGGGYSKCGEHAVTRWKEDAIRDNFGNFIFVKDISRNKLWSTTYQPLCKMPDSYDVTFGEDKVDFLRKDGDITTHTQIVVAPEDNVEIRHVTLTNNSGQARVLEFTSYLEPVLGSKVSDLDHPAFSKLFVQTEYLSSKKALLAHRRKRSEKDNEIWGLHVVVSDGEIVSDVEYETDRSKFIGRGREIANAQALVYGTHLTNTMVLH